MPLCLSQYLKVRMLTLDQQMMHTIHCPCWATQAGALLVRGSVFSMHTYIGGTQPPPSNSMLLLQRLVVAYISRCPEQAISGWKVHPVRVAIVLSVGAFRYSRIIIKL